MNRILHSWNLPSQLVDLYFVSSNSHLTLYQFIFFHYTVNMAPIVYAGYTESVESAEHARWHAHNCYINIDKQLTGKSESCFKVDR